jgi:Putative Actinobacterial Holin-X, holin superfamily III
MHTPGSESQGVGVGTAAKHVVDHVKTLAGLEVELAKLELGRKLGALGVGIGLLVGAAVFGVFGLAFVFATIAAALATFLATWLALLVVTLFLLVVAVILGLVGLGRVRRGTPPVPEQAIAEAKLTKEAFRSNGGG